jgi:hypothetical protein
VTDFQPRAARGKMRAPQSEPFRDHIGWQRQGVQPGPSAEDGILYFGVLVLEPPIRPALNNRIAEMRKAVRCTLAGSRPKRRSEALVAALMRLEGGHKIVIKRFARLQTDAPIERERDIDRQTARGRFDRETIEPFGRHQIE